MRKFQGFPPLELLSLPSVREIRRQDRCGSRHRMSCRKATHLHDEHGDSPPRNRSNPLSARQPHTQEVYALRQKATAVKPISGHLTLPLRRLGVPCLETFDQTPLTLKGATCFQASGSLTSRSTRLRLATPSTEARHTTHFQNQRQAGPPAFYSLCRRSSWDDAPRTQTRSLMNQHA